MLVEVVNLSAVVASAIAASAVVLVVLVVVVLVVLLVVLVFLVVLVVLVVEGQARGREDEEMGKEVTARRSIARYLCCSTWLYFYLCC